jgi:hypothetical protein
MFLKIHESKYMDLSILKNAENYMARISKEIRQKFSLKCGTYIKLECDTGEDVILQINPAYNEDLKLIPDFVGMFVTSYVAKQLGLNKPDTNTVNDLTLGMDPEAFIIDELGHTVDASKFFDGFKIGNDCGLLEFRPNPSTTPTGIVDNLYKLINKASKTLSPRWLDIVAASSFNLKPAGFHLHFGYNSGLKNHTSQIKLVGALLDYVVGVLMLTKEVRQDKYRRGSSQYGKPSDVKRSRVSFEYRVPGGRLMESPILAIGAVSIAEIAVKDFLSKCKNITENLAYPERFENYKQLQEMYPLMSSKDLVHEVLTNTTSTEIYLHKIVDNIIYTIQGLEGYESRKKEIEMFLNYKSTYMENNLVNHWKSEYTTLGET